MCPICYCEDGHYRYPMLYQKIIQNGTRTMFFKSIIQFLSISHVSLVILKNTNNVITIILNCFFRIFDTLCCNFYLHLMYHLFFYSSKFSKMYFSNSTYLKIMIFILKRSILCLICYCEYGHKWCELFVINRIFFKIKNSIFIYI